MKKIINIIAFLLLLVILVSCNEKPIQEDKTIYPVSSYEETLEITMGDVMPFYDNGVMNIYHLQNSRGSNSMFYHPISRLTTSDYINYKDEGIAINFEEEYSSPDAAIGTGSFIKDSEGLYHCFYTGHNAATDTGLPYVEVIRHATSLDQVIWTKDEEFNLYGKYNDFRDPYVYFDELDQMYYMLVTTRDINYDGYETGVIKRYSSESLYGDDSTWKDAGVFFWNDNGTYNMECPSYVEYNGYYYLVYSEQGDNRVTHYRYKTSSTGEWKRFERDSIDASGFYAGQIEKADGQLYAFAWCASLTGGFVGDFDWGGNLVCHKLIQSSNGELNAVIIDSILNSFDEEIEYLDIRNNKLENIVFEGDNFESICVKKLSKNATLLTFSFNVSNYNGDFGITFNTKKKDNRLGSALIAFDVKNSQIACYNNVSNIIRYGNVLASIPFVFNRDKNYKVNLLIENDIMTVYFDDSIAMTVRLPGVGNKNFAFYSNGIKVVIDEVKFYE